MLSPDCSVAQTKKLFIKLVSDFFNTAKAEGYFYSAEEIYRVCTNDDDSNDQYLLDGSMCLGYITAAYEGFIEKTKSEYVASTLGASLFDGYKFCEGKQKLAARTLIDIIINELKNKPKIRAEGNAIKVINNILHVWLNCGTPMQLSYLKSKGY